MKKRLFSLILITFLTISLTSCKDRDLVNISELLEKSPEPSRELDFLIKIGNVEIKEMPFRAELLKNDGWRFDYAEARPVFAEKNGSIARLTFEKGSKELVEELLLTNKSGEEKSRFDISQITLFDRVNFRSATAKDILFSMDPLIQSRGVSYLLSETGEFDYKYDFGKLKNAGEAFIYRFDRSDFSICLKARR